MQKQNINRRKILIALGVVSVARTLTSCGNDRNSAQQDRQNDESKNKYFRSRKCGFNADSE